MGVKNMPIVITRFSLGNIVGNFVMYGGLIGGIANVTPRKGLIKNRSDLAQWTVNKVIQRETNMQIVARRNARKQLK